MKKESKKTKVTAKLCFTIAGYVLLLAYAVLMILGRFIFSPISVFWRSINIFGTAGEFNAILRILSYAFFCLGVSSITRLVLKWVAKFLSHGKALIDLTCSLIKYAAIIVLVFFVLKTLGVDTTTILAGIGILGLVVGLGAQPLIADIIAGFFIIFEKLFDIGDIIVADGFRGTVKEIGVRTTKLIDAGGNIKILNNADLKNIVNMTNQLSLAVCDIGIEYGESLERVEAVLNDNLQAIKEAIPDIKDGPFYKGVAELGDSAVIIRFVANCEEGSRYQVERDMNRQFKLLFDKNNINIPFPQIVLNQPIKFEDATNKQKNSATEFVKEQKKLSKGIADSNINNV